MRQGPAACRLRTTAAVAVVLFLLGASGAELGAQSSWWFEFTYGAAVPGGDTRDFADDFSWRNLGLAARRSVGNRLSVGVASAWNIFAGRPDTTVTVGADGVDLTGTPYTYVNALPFLATAHYYVGPSGPGESFIGPLGYVGVGVGAYRIENRLDVGPEATFEQTNWHFGVAPEAGFAYKLGTPAALFFSVRYNHAFESGGFQHSYWSFNVGLGWGS